MRLNQTVPLGTAALLALANQVAGQGYQCPLMMPEEVTALKFAHAIQSWLSSYYAFNLRDSPDAMAFEDFPNASMVQSNGETLAANLVANMAGLAQQAKLAVEALEELGMGSDLSSGCDFEYPPGREGGGAMEFFQTSSFLEASLCGGFIGLADYVQNPAAAFLMARIAAEHGIHGSYLRSYVSPVSFMADSMSLTPAFTPEQLLQSGDGTASRSNVGALGKWINTGCLQLPVAPCGVDVSIGDLTASLSGGDAATPSITTTVVVSTSVGGYGTAETATGIPGYGENSSATETISAEILTPVTTVSDGNTIVSYEGTATATERAAGYDTTYAPAAGGTEGLELSTTIMNGDTFVSYVPAATDAITSGAAEYGTDAPNLTQTSTYPGSYATSTAGSGAVYSILPIGGPYGPDNSTSTPNPYANSGIAGGNATASGPAQFEGGAMAVSTQGLTIAGLLGLAVVVLI